MPQILDWLGDRFGWVGAVLAWVGGALAWMAAAFPDVAKAAAALIVLAIALGFTIRKARLQWLAWRPRVQVTAFTWTGAEEGEREALWVTSLFRERLGALRLDARDPLPERAAGAPLVDIVEGVAQGVGRKADVAKALGRLFRAIWPGAAYEVWGSLRPLGNGAGQISVQLVDGRRRALINVAPEESCWEDGARQAAMAVAGALYPHLRPRDRDPWALWAEAVPRQLVGDYFRAREHERGNRLEQALGAYHDALRRDPLNPQLRLRIAMLQERLALYLDAWVTYRAIVDERHRDAWNGPDRHVRILALYRLAILLGNGRVARQWAKRVSPGAGRRERDEERDRLRRELETALTQDDFLTGGPPAWAWRHLWRQAGRLAGRESAGALLAKLLGRPEASTEAERSRWVRDRLRLDDLRSADRRMREVNELLEIVSLRWLEELRSWLRLLPDLESGGALRAWWLRRPPPRQWLRRRELSKSVVGASQLFARIRIVTSEEHRRLAEPGPRPDQGQIHRRHKRLTSRWPFPATTPARRAAHWLAPRRRLANRRDDSWQLHYNAACVIASTLSDRAVPRNPENERDALPGNSGRTELVERAVAELDEYARLAGSDRVAAQASWLAIDDPDLEGLHGEPRFQLWASHHLPCRLPDTRPPRNVDVNRYTARVLCSGARSFAAAWRARGAAWRPTATELTDWWQEEAQAWRTLSHSCQERRSWLCRLEAVNALEAWLRANRPSQRIDFAHEDRGKTVASKRISGKLFEEIAALVEGDSRWGRGTIVSWADSRALHVRGCYERGEGGIDGPRLAPERERGEALAAARLWTNLAEALERALAEGTEDRAGRHRAGFLKPLREQLRVPPFGQGGREGAPP